MSVANRRAGGSIRLIVESRPESGGLFNEDFEPELEEAANRGGGGGHPAFAGQRFFRNSYAHQHLEKPGSTANPSFSFEMRADFKYSPDVPAVAPRPCMRLHMKFVTAVPFLRPVNTYRPSSVLSLNAGTKRRCAVSETGKPCRVEDRL
jgi:hypothetical protein